MNRRTRIRLLFPVETVTAVLLALSTLTEAQTQWTWRLPNPSGYILQGVASGNGFVVAVGNGVVVSSDGGVTWEDAGPVTRYGLWDVAFGNGQFVAVGNNGTSARSVNGRDWEVNEDIFAFNTQYVSLAFGLDRWIAVGQDGTVATSTDGLNFSAFDLPGGSPAAFHSASFGAGANGQGQFLLAGRDERDFDGFGSVATRGVIFSSTDGVNWTDVRSPSSADGFTIGYYIADTVWDAANHRWLASAPAVSLAAAGAGASKPPTGAASRANARNRRSEQS